MGRAPYPYGRILRGANVMSSRFGHFSAGLVMLLASGLGCSSSGNLTNGGGAGTSGSGTTTSSNCAGDPDHPSSCTYWTCMNVPTQFGNKTHCTSPQPPGMPHPGGSYNCPASGGGL